MLAFSIYSALKEGFHTLGDAAGGHDTPLGCVRSHSYVICEENDLVMMLLKSPNTFTRCNGKCRRAKCYRMRNNRAGAVNSNVFEYENPDIISLFNKYQCVIGDNLLSPLAG